MKVLFVLLLHLTNSLCQRNVLIKFDSTWFSSLTSLLSLLNLICHLFDQITAGVLINSKHRFILQNSMPCCLLVFSNSIFAFTFFVLFGCEKLCLAWSPPLQILLLHPWASWWHHEEKSQLAPQTTRNTSLRTPISSHSTWRLISLGEKTFTSGLKSVICSCLSFMMGSVWGFVSQSGVFSFTLCEIYDFGLEQKTQKI